MKSGMSLARRYGLDVRQAYAHVDGNWYWNLERFPGAYFDADGYVVFQTERAYQECVYLSIGPRNTWVRDKHQGMSIADIPGYSKLDPRPCML